MKGLVWLHSACRAFCGYTLHDGGCERGLPCAEMHSGLVQEGGHSWSLLADYLCGGSARGYSYTVEWYGALRAHFQVSLTTFALHQDHKSPPCALKPHLLVSFLTILAGHQSFLPKTAACGIVKLLTMQIASAWMMQIFTVFILSRTIAASTIVEAKHSCSWHGIANGHCLTECLCLCLDKDTRSACCLQNGDARHADAAGQINCCSAQID